MAKYSNAPVKRTYSAKTIKTGAATRTHQGGLGYTFDEKSQLFLLGVNSFMADKFYESEKDQVERITRLVQKIVVEDTEWVQNFVRWLRAEANMRSVAVVMAVEGAVALIKAGKPGGRALVAASMNRADEPAEVLGYYMSRYGKKIPQAIKRGVADGAKNLYNEGSLFKYDSGNIRFADVIQLTHPKAKDAKQSAVFKFALDRRYNKDIEIPEILKVAQAREEFKAISGDELRRLADAGELTECLRKSRMTWEALSSQIKGGMDAKAWEAVIPLMGYMALLRNLRNFVEKGVSRKVLDSVAEKLRDPAEVAKSRQLPFRFLTAYNEVPGDLFKSALGDALDASLANVPALSGRTLILVDASGSMGGKRVGSLFNQAALFGSALWSRADKADLYSFDTSVREYNPRNGDSVLNITKNFPNFGGGTDIRGAFESTFDNHDRVIILTDEQQGSFGGWSSHPDRYPDNVPVFIWNLAGYKTGVANQENVFNSGGLSDKAFTFIDLVSRAQSQKWPWED